MRDESGAPGKPRIKHYKTSFDPGLDHISGGNYEYIHFDCPGCGHEHYMDLSRWEWNQSLSSPTLRPSQIVRGDNGNYCCHFIITNGQIEFVGDSKHALSGKTVMLPELSA